MIGQPLTHKQMAVAVFMHVYHASNDNMPSYVEIARAFGVVTNAANEHVQRLKKHGVLELSENTARLRFARTPAGQDYRAQIVDEYVRQGGQA